MSQSQASKALAQLLAEDGSVDPNALYQRSRPLVQYLRGVAKYGSEKMAQRLSSFIDQCENRRHGGLMLTIVALVLTQHTKNPGPLYDWILGNLPTCLGLYGPRIDRDLIWTAIHYRAHGRIFFEHQRPMDIHNLTHAIAKLKASIHGLEDHD